jgi:radical SAM-linked protein
VAERLRVRFVKLGKVRFISHRDEARLWERAVRRSGLPVASSHGFNPRPLLAFGLALPTGAESLAEYLDITLVEEVARAGLEDVQRLATSLSEGLPAGMEVVGLGWLAGDASSLQEEVTSCSWDLEVRGVRAPELMRSVEQLLDAPSVSVRRERKGRAFDDDIRPAIRSLSVTPRPQSCSGGGSTWLQAELATRPRGVRPRELAEALGAHVVLSRARRTQQWIEDGAERREPLAMGAGVGAAIAAHAVERVS